MIPPVTDEPTNPPQDPQGDAQPTPEKFSHQPVAARVPERVAKGTFCTGQVILDGPKELVLDFLQGLTRPFQVVSRVVLTPQTAAEFSDALQKNVETYAKQFGTLPAAPVPPNQKRPTLAEVYENFRLSDDLLSGTYANAVLIGHSATEFFFDFITGFYPTSAVAARVFMPAPQVPRFVTALNASIEQHRQRNRMAPPSHEPPNQ